MWCPSNLLTCALHSLQLCIQGIKQMGSHLSLSHILLSYSKFSLAKFLLLEPHMGFLTLSGFSVWWSLCWTVNSKLEQNICDGCVWHSSNQWRHWAAWAHQGQIPFGSNCSCKMKCGWAWKWRQQKDIIIDCVSGQGNRISFIYLSVWACGT